VQGVKDKAGPAREKAEQELLKAQHEIKAKAELLRPAMQAAVAKAEPGLQDFLRNPQAEYLRKNPHVVMSLVALLATVGIPGAAPLRLLLMTTGHIDTVIPLVMMLVNPASAILGGPGAPIGAGVNHQGERIH